MRRERHSVSVTTSCPKCGVLWPADKPLPVTECPACGVNFAKFNAARVERQRQLAEQADRAAKAEKQMADRAAKAEKKAATAATKVKLHAAADAKLAACATCGGSVAYGAKTCPHCGAEGPTKPISRIKQAIVGIGVLVVLVGLFGESNPHMKYIDQRAGLSKLCPQMVQQSVVVPEEKAFFLSILLNEADRLNNSGLCVIEGGLGPDSGLYYLAVRNHSGGHPFFRRYSEKELLALRP